MGDIPERLAIPQLGEREAKDFAVSEKWLPMTLKERAIFQLRQDRLCMPFSTFHEAISELLEREVWTHEFARPDDLWGEYHGVVPKPSLSKIIDKVYDIRNGRNA